VPVDGQVPAAVGRQDDCATGGDGLYLGGKEVACYAWVDRAGYDGGRGLELDYARGKGRRSEGQVRLEGWDCDQDMKRLRHTGIGLTY